MFRVLLGEVSYLKYGLTNWKTERTELLIVGSINTWATLNCGCFIIFPVTNSDSLAMINLSIKKSRVKNKLFPKITQDLCRWRNQSIGHWIIRNKSEISILETMLSVFCWNAFKNSDIHRKGEGCFLGHLSFWMWISNMNNNNWINSRSLLAFQENIKILNIYTIYVCLFDQVLKVIPQDNITNTDNSNPRLFFK